MMAIDTATKRASVSGIPLLIPGVTPDLTPGEGWRRSAAWSFWYETPESIPSVLAPEVLSVQKIRRETLSVERLRSDTLAIPRVKPEVLSC